MARHIMAVCVVCLLCADRMPCEQHIDDGVYPANINMLNAKVLQRLDTPSSNEQNTKHLYSTENALNNQNQNRQYNSGNDKQHAQHRRKRHAGHSHGEEMSTNLRPLITEDFLQRIFDEYGHGDGSLRITEFRLMLKNLGLHQLIQENYFNNTEERNNSGSCIADSRIVQHLQEQKNHHLHSSEEDHHHYHDNDHVHHIHDNEISHKLEQNNFDVNCTLEEVYNSSSPCFTSDLDVDHSGLKILYLNNYTLTEEDVLNLCPVLLYQLASPLKSKREGCIERDILIEIEERSHQKFQTNKEDIVYVWIYAFISVFACGILGLVGVAIIPFMDSRYYKHIIQYLVSLAVGTMTGDALLHLLPHSLAGHTESEMIYKGLTCMGGIIFFYITEHGLTMISEWRKRKAKKDTKQSRAKVVRDPDSSITNSVAGDKLCKSKYSSYPYCYDEIAMDTKNDVWMHLPNNMPNVEMGTSSERKRNGRSEANANEIMAAQSLLSTSQNNYAPMTDMTNHNHQHQDHQQQQHSNHVDLENHSLNDTVGGVGNVVSNNAAGNGRGSSSAASTGCIGNSNNKDNKSNDTVTVILREHESSHHGHSHKHGHVHSPPESLSAVAWMIIMGDGLHNFTDGMAIGAAFAENIAGGFSTSLAVFCHELPHELGDFAILMKAGMSVKSAVYYNLLTGVLSFIGMIFGIVFGQSPAAAQWMFAAAAGLFIYIALVDMMPELSASHKSLEQLALQIVGMSTGVFLMLLIAIYEGDLMNIFSNSSSKSSSLLSSSSLSSFEPASGH